MSDDYFQRNLRPRKKVKPDYGGENPPPLLPCRSKKSSDPEEEASDTSESSEDSEEEEMVEVISSGQRREKTPPRAAVVPGKRPRGRPRKNPLPPAKPTFACPMITTPSVPPITSADLADTTGSCGDEKHAPTIPKKFLDHDRNKFNQLTNFTTKFFMIASSRSPSPLPGLSPSVWSDPRFQPYLQPFYGYGSWLFTQEHNYLIENGENRAYFYPDIPPHQSNTFCFHSPESFALYIVSSFCKTNRFASFEANLRLYGFLKVPDSKLYFHPIIRYDPNDEKVLLHTIKKAVEFRRQTHNAAKKSGRFTDSKQIDQDMILNVWKQQTHEVLKHIDHMLENMVEQREQLEKIVRNQERTNRLIEHANSVLVNQSSFMAYLVENNLCRPINPAARARYNHFQHQLSESPFCSSSEILEPDQLALEYHPPHPAIEYQVPPQQYQYPPPDQTQLSHFPSNSSYVAAGSNDPNSFPSGGANLLQQLNSPHFPQYAYEFTGLPGSYLSPSPPPPQPQEQEQEQKSNTAMTELLSILPRTEEPPSYISTIGAKMRNPLPGFSSTP